LAIAISRVTDFWHHPTDVITGLLLGFVMSFGFYRLAYPALTSPACHVPIYELLPSPDKGSGGLYSPHPHHHREPSPHALGGAGGGPGQGDGGEGELPSLLAGVVVHSGSGLPL
jgi:hypothetical protein